MEVQSVQLRNLVQGWNKDQEWKAQFRTPLMIRVMLLFAVLENLKVTPHLQTDWGTGLLAYTSYTALLAASSYCLCTVALSGTE